MRREEMSDVEEPSSEPVPGPDWVVLGLVLAAAAVLVLAAAAAPMIGGIGGFGAVDAATSVDGGDAPPHLGEFLDGADGIRGANGWGGDGAFGEPPGDALEGDGAAGGNPGDATAEPPSDGRAGAPSPPGADAGAVGPPESGAETRIGGDAAFTAADDTVHFTVEADRPAYWRLTAYDEYDHDGWIDSGEANRLEGVPAAGDRRVLEQVVTIEATTSTVPAAWRPLDVYHPTREFNLEATGGVRADQPLEPGERVTVLSALPVDRDRLQAAGTAYPRDLETRYTALPEAVPDRVHDRTAAITADAETPYETAAAVETYLRSNYGYALAVDPPTGDVTDELLFEREEAYCAHFATAMTVMLRSQDVPARYVVGYNAGEYDPETGEYVVRGMHAHAWVEVYFPEYGWVPFEPTPPSSRADAIGEAAAAGAPAPTDVAPGGDESPVAVPDRADLEGGGAVPADRPGDASGTGEAGLEGNGSTGAADGELGSGPTVVTSGYVVSFDDPLVPGSEVGVRVTEDGAPAPDVTVSFDGERIGTTDASGRVTGEVPYVLELAVAVEAPGDDGTGTDRSARLGSSPSAHLTGSTQVAAVEFSAAVAGGVVQSGETVPTESDAALEIEGRATPGSDLEVLATVGERPIPDGTVTVDGEAVTRTDDAGRATVSVPDRPGNVTIAVERGEIVAEETVVVRALEIAVVDRFPLPGRPVEVAVSHGEDPVEDVEIAVDGEVVAEGAPNGTATVSLPIASEATVVAASDGASASTTVTGLYRNAAVLLGSAALGLAGSIVILARRGLLTRQRLRRLPARAASSLSSLGTRAVDWVVRAAGHLEAIVHRFGRRLRDARGAIRRVGRRLLELPATLAERGFSAFAGLHPGRLLTIVFAVLGRLIGSARRRANALTARDTSSNADDLASGSAAAGGSADDPVATLRALWAAFLEWVDPPAVRTKTPAEIGRYAVDRGVPSAPVWTVVEAFREAEYGNAKPTRTRLERVREAVDAVADDPDRADVAPSEPDAVESAPSERRSADSTDGGDR